MNSLQSLKILLNQKFLFYWLFRCTGNNKIATFLFLSRCSLYFHNISSPTSLCNIHCSVVQNSCNSNRSSRSSLDKAKGRDRNFFCRRSNPHVASRVYGALWNSQHMSQPHIISQLRIIRRRNKARKIRFVKIQGKLWFTCGQCSGALPKAHYQPWRKYYFFWIKQSNLWKSGYHAIIIEQKNLVVY